MQLTTATPDQAINLVNEIESKYEKDYPPNCSNFVVKHQLAKMVLNNKISEQQKGKLIKEADSMDLIKALSNKALSHNDLPFLTEIFIKLVNSLAWFDHLEDVDALVNSIELDHLENNCAAACNAIEDYEYERELKSCKMVKI